jgi:hypothetical protein
MSPVIVDRYHARSWDTQEHVHYAELRLGTRRSAVDPIFSSPTGDRAPKWLP